MSGRKDTWNIYRADYGVISSLQLKNTGGEETNNVKKQLSFDPTADLHEYRFDFYPDRIDFYADDELLQHFTEGLPKDPMCLYLNAWFPKWLPGRKPETNRYTYVDWMQH